MISEQIGKPHESNKVYRDQKDYSAYYQCYLDLLDDGDCQKDHCYSQQHVFDGHRPNVSVLIIVHVEEGVGVGGKSRVGLEQIIHHIFHCQSRLSGRTDVISGIPQGFSHDSETSTDQIAIIIKPKIGNVLFSTDSVVLAAGRLDTDLHEES